MSILPACVVFERRRIRCTGTKKRMWARTRWQNLANDEPDEADTTSELGEEIPVQPGSFSPSASAPVREERKELGPLDRASSPTFSRRETKSVRVDRSHPQAAPSTPPTRCRPISSLDLSPLPVTRRGDRKDHAALDASLCTPATPVPAAVRINSVPSTSTDLTSAPAHPCDGLSRLEILGLTAMHEEWIISKEAIDICLRKAGLTPDKAKLQGALDELEDEGLPMMSLAEIAEYIDLITGQEKRAVNRALNAARFKRRAD